MEDVSSDVEGDANIDDMGEAATDISGHSLAFLWKKSSSGMELVRINHPDEIIPGDIVVIEAGNADHSNYKDFRCLGEIPDFQDSPARIDASQQSYLESHAKALLRLHDGLIGLWPPGDSRQLAGELLVEAELEDPDPDAQLYLMRRMLDVLVEDSRSDPRFAWLHDTARQLRAEAKSQAFLQNLYRIGSKDLVLTGRRLLRKYIRQAETFNDEDDQNSSGTAHRLGQPVPLKKHLSGVEAWARHFALGCGLPDELVEAVARAGLLHDTGKADPRFQALLNGGRPLLVAKEPLAKSASMNRTRAALQTAHKKAGYPVGCRHELLSVRLAESAPGLLPDDPLMRELTLHLVASHHGHCRPFAPVVIDEDAPEVRYRLCGHEMTWAGSTRLEHLAEGATQRFWTLNEAYGWWGLAWLESILRLADHRRSEWEELSDATRNDK